MGRRPTAPPASGAYALFRKSAFDALLCSFHCLAKPSHLRCELMLAPPLSMIVGSSLTPREMKLPSAGLLLPAAAQVAAPKVHSRFCHSGEATASSRSNPREGSTTGAPQKIGGGRDREEVWPRCVLIRSCCIRHAECLFLLPRAHPKPQPSPLGLTEILFLPCFICSA